LSAGVVAALLAEARTLGSPAAGKGAASKGEVGRGAARKGLFTIQDGTLVAVSGMGPAAAAGAAQALAEAGATALVSWGMAGGLDPSLPAGTICLPTRVLAASGASFGTDHHWREAVGAAIAARRRVVDGTLLTTLQALHDIAGKAAAFQATGALAVDMESAAVAEVAAKRRLPFIAVRVIVDTAGDALPGAVLAASSGTGGQVSVPRLLQALLGAPGDLVPLLRLAQRYRAAIRALTAVARSGALAPLAFAVASGNRIA
jgi:adenosylhomocysteine nucleosidase